jgi:crossover junction endodeoxyribonuclease RusA
VDELAAVLALAGDDEPEAPARTLIASFAVEVAQPKERHRTGRGRSYTPTRTVNAENEVRTAFRDAARSHVADKARYAIALTVTGSHHSSDVDNLAKTIMDGLQGEVYVNDHQVDVLAVRRIRGRRTKRSRIAVYRIEEA